MPEVARIDGVKIRFYPREHPPPHFHAVFAEYRAQIEIRPFRVLRGSLPPAKLTIVKSWAESRQEALLDVWYKVLAKRAPERIR